MSLPVVNGRNGLVITIGVASIAVIALIGMIVLAAVREPIPAELGAAFTGALTFLIGTRVSTPDVSKTIVDDNKITGKYDDPPPASPKDSVL